MVAVMFIIQAGRWRGGLKKCYVGFGEGRVVGLVAGFRGDYSWGVYRNDSECLNSMVGQWIGQWIWLRIQWCIWSSIRW